MRSLERFGLGIVRPSGCVVLAMAEKWGHLAVGEKLTVKDVFAQRYHAGMTNLEEGILKHWSWGRLV